MTYRHSTCQLYTVGHNDNVIVSNDAFIVDLVYELVRHMWSVTSHLCAMCILHTVVMIHQYLLLALHFFVNVHFDVLSELPLPVCVVGF